MATKKNLKNAYQAVDPEEMILRDHLAFDRTVLANERTALAYARTCIALLATGLMILKLFYVNSAFWSLVFGSLFICSSLLLVMWGVIRFLYCRRRMEHVYQESIEERSKAMTEPSSNHDIHSNS